MGSRAPAVGHGGNGRGGRRGGSRRRRRRGRGGRTGNRRRRGHSRGPITRRGPHRAGTGRPPGALIPLRRCAVAAARREVLDTARALIARGRHRQVGRVDRRPAQDRAQQQRDISRRRYHQQVPEPPDPALPPPRRIDEHRPGGVAKTSRALPCRSVPTPRFGVWRHCLVLHSRAPYKTDAALTTLRIKRSYQSIPDARMPAGRPGGTVVVLPLEMVSSASVPASRQFTAACSMPTGTPLVPLFVAPFSGVSPAGPRWHRNSPSGRRHDPADRRPGGE